MQTLKIEKTFVEQSTKQSTNIPYNSNGEVRGVAWENVKEHIKFKFAEFYGVSYDKV